MGRRISPPFAMPSSACCVLPAARKLPPPSAVFAIALPKLLQFLGIMKKRLALTTWPTLFPSQAHPAINAVSPTLKKYVEKIMKTTNILIVSIALIAGSFAGAARAETNLLLVCNKGDRTLSVINPETGGQIAVVNEDGVTGHEVVAS